MKVFQTDRFGELSYHQKDVIHLAGGLIGLPHLRRWLLLDIGDNLPLKWLQSLDREGFGLPVSLPVYFRDSYEVVVPPEVCQQLQAPSVEDLAVLIITTIHEGGTKITGNLLAPLLINTESRRGVQLTLPDESLPVKQEINYLKFGLAVESLSAQNGSCGPADQEQEQKRQEAAPATCKVVSL
jgi:flagellar assembly factor FliW